MNMKPIEVGKYYTAYPEFTRLEGVQSRGADSREPVRKKKLSGKCIQVTHRLVILEFANGLRESFRHDEVW